MKNLPKRKYDAEQHGHCMGAPFEIVWLIETNWWASILSPLKISFATRAISRPQAGHEMVVFLGIAIILDISYSIENFSKTKVKWELYANY